MDEEFIDFVRDFALNIDRIRTEEPYLPHVKSLAKRVLYKGEKPMEGLEPMYQRAKKLLAAYDEMNGVNCEPQVSPR